MKILLLSPLFPPDTGDPAEYAKELVARLANEHSVTALIYGHLPESVPNVLIEAIDKRQGLVKRLFQFTLALYQETHKADLVIVNNAPSTELPALLVSLVRPNVMVLCESDPLASQAAQRGFYHLVHSIFKRHCQKLIVLPAETTYKRAEILPFQSSDSLAESVRETWWNEHLAELTNI